jgi:hypothetical protein
MSDGPAFRLSDVHGKFAKKLLEVEQLWMVL